MSNDWYAPTHFFPALAKVRYEHLNTEFLAVQSGLDNLDTDLPALLATYSEGAGLPDFTGESGSVLVVDGLATGFSTETPLSFMLGALPAAAGNGGKLIGLADTEDGGAYVGEELFSVDSDSFSAESSVEISIPSGYAYSKVIVHGLYCDTAGRNLQIRVDIDDTLISTSDYQGSTLVHSSTASYSATISAIAASTSSAVLGTSTATPSVLVIHVFNSGSQRPHFIYEFLSSGSGSEIRRMVGKFCVGQSGDITSITIYPTSALITGAYAAYGVKTSE